MLTIKVITQWRRPKRRLRKVKVYLEPAEIASMESTATNLRDKLLVRLLFRLGCRISEALALTVGDIDFERSTVIIKHLKARLKLSCTECGQRLGRSHAFCPKCGSKVEKAKAEQLKKRGHRVSQENVSKRLGEMVRGGRLVRDGHGLYHLAAAVPKLAPMRMAAGCGGPAAAATASARSARAAAAAGAGGMANDIE